MKASSTGESQGRAVGRVAIALCYAVAGLVVICAVLVLVQTPRAVGAVSRIESRPASVLVQSAHGWPHEFRRARLYDGEVDGLYAWPHEFARARSAR